MLNILKENVEIYYYDMFNLYLMLEYIGDIHKHQNIYQQVLKKKIIVFLSLEHFQFSQNLEPNFILQVFILAPYNITRKKIYNKVKVSHLIKINIYHCSDFFK